MQSTRLPTYQMLKYVNNPAEATEISYMSSAKQTSSLNWLGLSLVAEN